MEFIYLRGGVWSGRSNMFTNMYTNMFTNMFSHVSQWVQPLFY